MKTETSFIKKGSAALLSGALVLAFSPAMFAPAAFAGETQVNAVKSIVDVYMTNGSSSAVTEQAAADVVGALSTYNVQVDELPQEYQVYVLRCQLYDANSDLEEANQELKSAQDENTKLQNQVTKLQKQLEEAQSQISSTESTTLKTKTRIVNVKVGATTMGKLTVSWSASNAVDGMKYQILRKAAGSSKVAKTKTKATKKTFKLNGGVTYSFQVRAYKKIGGKTVFSKKSKKVSATVVPVYGKGSYTVKGDLLHVRKTTSVSSDLLVDILKGTTVKVTSVKVVNGVAWGKVTYNGKTGWVQMQYLKSA